MKRRLSLKAERLAELTSADLQQVAGASAPACVTRDFCKPPSDYVASLCCATEYCG